MHPIYQPIRRHARSSISLLQPGQLTWLILLVIVGLVFSLTASAELSVKDDAGREIRLKTTAQRIITLAPSATELIFSAGAGDKLVGTVSFSNYPSEAARTPVIGSYNQFDFEKILALSPDLVIGWQSGNDPAAIERLEQFGLPVFLTETRHLDQLPQTLRKLGILAGTTPEAQQTAQTFEHRLSGLRQTYQHRHPVPVFYQVWDKPLITVNHESLISQVITLCGGRNVFSDLASIAPRIDIEAVIAKNPAAIIASGMDEERPEWLEDWKRWDSITAVRNNQLYFIPPDQIQRQTLRVLNGAEQLCAQLDQARHTLPIPPGNH